MMSLRKHRTRVNNLMRDRPLAAAFEDKEWGRMAPIGREFGSPDFERLMEEDRRNRVGVFDPALSGFDARADAAQARFQQTGAGVPAQEVVAEMRERLEARRRELQDKHRPADT